MVKIKRDTNKILMESIFSLVKENGCYEKAESIMDYYLPESYKLMELSNYEFDFVATVAFGSNEGIYLDCYITGLFREDNKDNKAECLSCGTFKTLSTDLASMQIMGELAGSLTYFARKYVNQEIDRYTPTSEREAEERRKIEKAVNVAV